MAGKKIDKIKKLENLKDSIVVTNDSFSYANENYSRIRDNTLLFMNSGEKKVIAVQSSLSNELKTTVVSNLAVSFGCIDKKVLVIDLDFRNPNVHRVFNVEKEDGLVDVMLEKITIEQAIKTTEYKNVDILSRGMKVYNPSFILLSNKFLTLIEKLKESYDVILFDTAPVLEVSDYVYLSKISDGSIFLATYGATKKRQVVEAINELKNQNIEIISVVFTKYPNRDGNRKYYYGNYGE